MKKTGKNFKILKKVPGNIFEEIPGEIYEGIRDTISDKILEGILVKTSNSMPVKIPECIFEGFLEKLL